MKHLIKTKLTAVAFFVFGCTTFASPLSISNTFISMGADTRVTQLSEDKDLHNVFNTLFSVTHPMAKAKRTDLLSKFADKTATVLEMDELVSIMGLKNIAELNGKLESVQQSSMNLKIKYTFLNEKEGNQILKEALVEAAKKGKLGVSSRVVEVDCVAAYMAAFSFCYFAYYHCIENPTANNWNCEGYLAACLGSISLGYFVCYQDL